MSCRRWRSVQPRRHTPSLLVCLDFQCIAHVIALQMPANLRGITHQDPGTDVIFFVTLVAIAFAFMTLTTLDLFTWRWDKRGHNVPHLKQRCVYSRALVLDMNSVIEGVNLVAQEDLSCCVQQCRGHAAAGALSFGGRYGTGCNNTTLRLGVSVFLGAAMSAYTALTPPGS